ncbi:Ima1 N-terminal domain-containing protein [Neurospora intermedia]|uniref:Ima1 N-terminal domain-containing protein n=1 Tax=Neurospora intermedia TaxID=5142 RepID=A0ABR3DCF3_NEUIN
MPRLNRTRYLTCFYCGRKTSTPWNSSIRNFECRNCDATNYLDGNGDITDPPVATEYEASPAKFATTRATSPTVGSSSASVFCNKCLANQDKLRAVLAQYLPDPDDSEYEERCRNIYKFRRLQERLYPQMCAECEPRVQKKLGEAAYTAKTDVLLRMIERSNKQRQQVTGWSWLNVFDSLGRWLRTASLVLQLLWHLSIMLMLFKAAIVTRLGETPNPWTLRAVNTCFWFFNLLPSTDRLSGWSLTTAILSVWWNPRYPQLHRGFTKHITGFRAWYMYQAILVFMRFWVRRLPILAGPEQAELNMPAAAHVFWAGFTILVHLLAPRAIRIDMAPLFGTASKPSAPQGGSVTQPSTYRPTTANTAAVATGPRRSGRAVKPSAQLLAARSSFSLSLPPAPAPAPAPAPVAAPAPTTDEKPDEIKVMVDLLDEIVNGPSSPASPTPSIDHSPFFVPRVGRSNVPTTPGSPFSPTPRRFGTGASTGPGPFFSSLGPAANTRSATAAYTQEMDWTPTQSQYRAFQTVGQRENQGFNEAPTDENKGPFWYRVPPAPTAPAQRLNNYLTKQPRIIAPRHTAPRPGTGIPSFGSTALVNTPQKQILGRINNNDHMTMTMRRDAGEDTGIDPTPARVAFAPPKFFVPPPQNDPRNSLSEMLGRSFSLSQEEEEEQREAEREEAEKKSRGWLGGGLLTFRSTPAKKDQ